jgi:(R,R)-butanediol dehydrogenase/meso-butanediol dehydrogenase/diacetyl reductase
MVGDSVAVDPNYRCGQCQFCRNHLSHLCDRGTEQYYSNRGYAQYVDIDESYVHKLPRFREPFIGALVEPLSVALNATSTLSTQDEKGDVLILGAGSIGSLIAFAILSLSDADVTMHDRSGEKLDRLRSIYGQRVRPLSSNEAMSFRTIIEATGHGAGFGVACDRLAKDGHIVIVSRYHSSEPRIPDRLPWKAPRITFAHLNGDGVAFLQAAELLFTKWTPAHDVLLECLPFRDINQAFEAFDQGTFNKKLIKMGPD